MKNIKYNFKKIISTINFDGLRCTIKGDPSMREIVCALKRQKEIDSAENRR